MWYSSTADNRWILNAEPASGAHGAHGVQLTGQRQQAVRGFGGCFNELGYLPLAKLNQAQQDEILRDLFSPSECDFSFNRAPVGANDFAADWYSYDETPGDLALEHFSVERDEQAVIPFIRGAQQHQPEMQLHAAPWSPPTWMKNPPVYNHGRLIRTPENLDAYARYLSRYVTEYAARGIRVDQLHVQNEVFADQKFPSCKYSSEELRVFIRDHLGPRFEADGLDTEIWLGTLNGPEDYKWTPNFDMELDNYNRFVDNILLDDQARAYIKGIGYQWAGQNALQRTHDSWPEIEIVQTESECGMGRNDWEYAEYIFHLIQHYFRNGATAYTYWNMILAPGGNSTWGWHQNSLFTVDADAGTFVRNPEYYVMRHYSHFVKRGAVRLDIEGHYSSVTSVFENPDGSLAVIVGNALDRPETFTFTDPQRPGRSLTAELAPRSFNTFIR